MVFEIIVESVFSVVVVVFLLLFIFLVSVVISWVLVIGFEVV